MNIYKLHLDIKINILKGKFNFLIKYKKDSKKIIEKNIKEILLETKNNLFLKKIEIIEIKNLFNSDYKVSILFNYNEIDKKYINDYLNKIILQSDNLYDKIEEIYDFIFNNFTYNKNQKNFVNMLKYGNGNFECISLLFSLLCDKFNINNIIIKGFIGKKTNRIYQWNLIEIDNEWYNIDISLDVKNKLKLNFLLPDYCFKNHLRDNDYITNDFYNTYPSAVAKYGMKNPNLKYLKIKQLKVHN